MPPTTTRSPIRRPGSALAAIVAVLAIGLTALASPVAADEPAPDKSTARFEVGTAARRGDSG